MTWVNDPVETVMALQNYSKQDEIVTVNMPYLTAGMAVRGQFRKFIALAPAYDVEASYLSEDKGLIESTFYKIKFEGKVRDMVHYMDILSGMVHR